ncbi:MAG: hypothetical protein RBS39_07820 [Phycisphaerales bacterium]|nr:hypothetical protein [Phycisphaerales bacterium]
MPEVPPSHPEPPTPHEPESSRRARRARRLAKRWWLRRRFWTFLALFVLLALTIVTRTRVMHWIVMPRLVSATGLDVRASRVVLDPNGTMVIHDVSVWVPGVPGDAGEVAHVDVLRADIDWVHLILGGGLRVERVSLNRPVVRVSQDVSSGEVSIENLFTGATGGRPSSELPQVYARDGTIELGEHDATRYTPLRQMHVTGELVPDAARNGYLMRLVEVRSGLGAPGSAPIDIGGWISDAGMVMTLDEVSLADWPAASVPSPVRSLMQRFDLGGHVRRSTFTYSFTTGVSAELELDGVGVTLPFDERGDVSFDPRTRGMRMSEVTGRIAFRKGGVDAKLTGVLEDLPYTVDLRYDGLTADAPFHCVLMTENFRLEERPGLLPFAPEIVKFRLQSFSNPTGLVSSRVEVSRVPTPEGGAGEVRIAGWIQFSQGRAAFHYFPYPFEDLSGIVEFDNDKIEIKRVTGRSISGARITASGIIAPPHANAHVDLLVQASEVPVDDRLREAIGPGRNAIIDALFNAREYATLRQEGLLLTREEARTLRAEKATIDAVSPELRTREQRERLEQVARELERPAFDLGGRANIEVHLQREEGEGSEWMRTILVDFPRCGLVPEHFPFPIEAEDLTLDIGESEAVVRDGRFRGLRGGTARVDAVAEFVPPERGGLIPRVRIDASGVPIDQLLLRALPEGTPAAPVRDIVTGLGLVGSIDCVAEIGPREDVGLGFDVRVGVDSASARVRPREEGRDLVLAALKGVVQVSERAMHASLAATPEPGSDDARVVIEADLSYAPLRLEETPRLVAESSEPPAPVISEPAQESPTRVRAIVSGWNIDAALPIEDAAGLFSVPAAEAIERLRETYSPRGAIDARAEIEGPVGADLAIVVEMGGARGLELTLDGRQLTIGQTAGTIRADVLPGRAIHMRGVHAEVVGEGATPAAIEGEGDLALTEAALTRDPSLAASRLDLRVKDARFESPLVASVARESLGERIRAAYDERAPEGMFDLLVRLTSTPRAAGPEPDAPPPLDASVPADPGLAIRVRGELMPHEIDFNHAGERIALREMSGSIGIGESAGPITGLTGKGEGFDFTADGSWSAREDGSTSYDVSLAMRADRFSDDLLAMVPEPVRDGMNAVSFDPRGDFALESTRATVEYAPDGVLRSVTFAGTLRLTNASLVVGAGMEECAGRVRFEARRDAIGQPLSAMVGVALESARGAGIALRNVRARVTTTDSGETWLVPLIAADCYGGRIAGDASLRSEPGPDGAPIARSYKASLRAAGVRFAPLAQDLRDAASERPGAQTPANNSESRTSETDAERTSPMDVGRGLLDVDLVLEGLVAQPETRRGRGMVQISGGPVVRVPLLVPLMQVGNLQLPSGAELDLARASMFIVGNDISFEELSAFAQDVEVYGYGTMDWPTMQLNLHLTSRATSGVPVLSRVFEAVRDELLTLRVRGTPGDPRVEAVSLEGTRGLLGAMLGRPEPEDAEMRRIAELSRENRERARRAASRASTPGVASASGQ